MEMLRRGRVGRAVSAVSAAIPLSLCENAINDAIGIEVHLGSARLPVSVIPDHKPIAVCTDASWLADRELNLIHGRQRNACLKPPVPPLAINQQGNERDDDQEQKK